MNLANTLQRIALADPERPAVFFGEQLLHDYGQLARRAAGLAAALRGTGLVPGDRIALCLHNHPAYLELLYGAWWAGLAVVPVNAKLHAREAEWIIGHAGAKWTFATEDIAASLQLAVPCIDVNSKLYQELTASTPLDTITPREPQDLAWLFYTSGTTGRPKGVMLTHRNLLFIAAVSSTLRGLTRSDRAWGVLPISHVYGLASVALGTLYAGAALYLVPRFSVDGLLAALKDDGLTIVQGVPAMYAKLLQTLGGADTPLPTRLRFAYAGGSPLAPSLKHEVEKLLGTALHNGYGMTESAPTISQTRLETPRLDDSVGTPIPGVEVRVVDVAGKDVAPGEPGELWIRGPNIMAGYYREPAMTAATMRDGGWLNTGDMARQDPDGALFIVGRTKELIIRSGFNVYPLEVETALNAHASVVQSAVVGRTLADGNEDVIAYVELDPRQPASVAELQAWLAQTLSPYKCPSAIIVMEALPAAATGKILKGQLRQMAQNAR